jgi:hypothetical protein
VSRGNTLGMVRAEGINGDNCFCFLDNIAEQIFRVLQIKIAAFFVLFQPEFVRIVIAGLAAVNAVVSEHAQDGALQNHAKKTELTLRFIERKGEKVAALQSPESRKVVSAWLTVARRADFFSSSCLMRRCSGVSSTMEEGVAAFSRCSKRAMAPASSKSRIAIARPCHEESATRRRRRKVIELAK